MKVPYVHIVVFKCNFTHLSITHSTLTEDQLQLNYYKLISSDFIKCMPLSKVPESDELFKLIKC